MRLRHTFEAAFRSVGQEMRILRTHARPGGVGVDIGAARGVYSYALLELCRRVEAFEPNPASAADIRAHGDPRIVVHQEALSSSDGEATLFVPRDEVGLHPASGRLTRVAAGARGETTRVRCATLDEHDLRDVTIVKIDVEGHEREVLRGARRTIERERPALLVEIEARHLDVPIREVFDEIEALGYDGWFITGRNRLASLREFDPTIHQVFVPGRPPRPSYVNNFFFLPLSRGGG